MKLMLEAIRRDRLRDGDVWPRRSASPWLVTYVEAPGADAAPARAAATAEGRHNPRKRVRFRSAKVLDANHRFLCDARIQDLSQRGMRLALASNIGLPARFFVFEDETGELRSVEAAWRRGQVLGIRCFDASPPRPLKASDRFALGHRYYGVPDC